MVVIGRKGSSLSWRLALPPLVTVVAWSAWVLSAARPEAFGASLALPLMKKPDWALAGWVLAFGLPWSPFAALACWRSVREGWPATGRSYVMGWVQTAAALLLAGTVIPGLGDAARVPALAGLAVAAAACCSRAWSGPIDAAPRRAAVGLALVIGLAWAALAVPAGSYLAATIAFYRPLAVALAALASLTFGVALLAAWHGCPRRGMITAALVAACLKLGHWGVYVPEWNYRCSQGPWGRAIGQWVPPRWPIYSVLAWRPDLAFATGHPFRLLADPRHLEYQPHPPGQPQFVLLLPMELANWPESAPKLIPVRTFLDERGEPRVLARTEGDLSAPERGDDN
jgi:hypothetical protein